ncbi:MAG: cobalt-precorrin-5B (C(1))-methyltransferase [Gammaproteobacteria bacterium]|uniref:Cobalt-precorrin-5B C(1)-methyltransferase n=1 Tax=Candidatus Thiopontia autotrophica TaxID=2841688 RepID=A0A8J6TPT7_9GAMM|nr:cobalt-precorrin-5B (C(1))-methyltransferase [Candidatus Thiopontia autotrophica]MBL6969001.1 cobalt-precorrin-5B (C(1))-methyltransferase [Gammaproteobacteria bacterium]
MQRNKKKGSRKGYTTGANSAAAARAAVIGLISGEVPDEVEALLPNGERVLFPVIDGAVTPDSAHAVVVKDAGDDPDVTDKAHMTADVRILESSSGVIELLGGVGVGTVTRPGLGLEVGKAAINPTPRKNIEENIREVGSALLKRAGIEIIISVPDGEERAKRTLNHRLGILGGISILGTTGIVHPYSTAAFRASVIQGIEVAARQGQDTVVLTTGGRTEKFVIRSLPELDESCFVQMGDFLSYALDTVVDQGIAHVVIGGMVGKLTKMAQGETITHANRNAVNTGLLADLAAKLGVEQKICDEIRDADTARFASERMEEIGLTAQFHHALAEKVIATLSGRYPGKFSIKVLVCDFDGNPLAQAFKEIN